MDLPEIDYKNKLIEKLNILNCGWIDGDLEKGKENQKTVDIVNHILKICIEIKDDNTFHSMGSGSINLDWMNKKYREFCKSANNKFKNYLDYKTILLIRTRVRDHSSIKYSIEGLDSFGKINDILVYKGRTGKYSDFVISEIGSFLIIGGSGSVSYFLNKKSKEKRMLEYKHLKNIYGVGYESIIDLSSS